MTRIIAGALTLAILSGGEATAQWSGRAWYHDPILTRQDRQIIIGTVQREIRGKGADTVTTWSNPETGHSGTIRLLGTSVRQNMPCEKIEYRIRSSKPGERAERYVLTSCRIVDGTWKLAD